MKENLVREKSFDFALKSIELSRQFMRSATSIGANIEEATAAYSKREFASKMSIASKEARETLYWLKLLEAGNYFTNYDFQLLRSDCERLIRILTAIVKTTQSNIS